MKYFSSSHTNPKHIVLNLTGSVTPIHTTIQYHLLCTIKYHPKAHCFKPDVTCCTNPYQHYIPPQSLSATNPSGHLSLGFQSQFDTLFIIRILYVCMYVCLSVFFHRMLGYQFGIKKIFLRYRTPQNSLFLFFLSNGHNFYSIFINKYHFHCLLVP